MTTKTTIKAGGGVVINPKGEILMIFRRGHWDLPKGKLEEGESIECCALREVEEECGIGDLILGRFICITEHNYTEHGCDLIKQTHWFAMQGEGLLTPQLSEDITRACWVDPAEVPVFLEQSYPSIAEVFREFGLPRV
ncbi:MAG: NUDIX domain-containing protein [Mucinivorans sp.]